MARRATPSLLAVGTSGMDSSYDGGVNWSSALDEKREAREDMHAYNAVSCSGNTCWVVGPGGRIVKTPRPLPVTVN